MVVSICCSALYTTDTSQMAEYTLHELMDMHLLYGETRGNSRAARRLYVERFPMRRLPSHVLFQRIDAHMRETGHVVLTRRGAGRPRSVQNVVFQDCVLQLFEETPSTNKMLREARITPTEVGNLITGLSSTEALHNLHSLRNQLTALLRTKLKRGVPVNDTTANPMFWVSRWFNSCSNNLFAFELCDRSVGASFEDCTTLVLQKNDSDLLFAHMNGTEEYYTLEDYPTDIESKITDILGMQSYMAQCLLTSGTSLSRRGVPPERAPYIKDWVVSTFATSMYLTNGTLQVNFTDHTKLILCPLMGAVTFIEKENKINTYRFTTLKQNGCPRNLTTRLKYALSKMERYFLKF
ncbi:hypothetical protein C0J52_11831 [Blattella germanica]|nr:hypothetical protein C0J52_11831 [Blattella germanica]